MVLTTGREVITDCSTRPRGVALLDEVGDQLARKTAGARARQRATPRASRDGRLHFHQQETLLRRQRLWVPHARRCQSRWRWFVAARATAPQGRPGRQDSPTGQEPVGWNRDAIRRRRSEAPTHVDTGEVPRALLAHFGILFTRRHFGLPPRANDGARPSASAAIDPLRLLFHERGRDAR